MCQDGIAITVDRLLFRKLSVEQQIAVVVVTHDDTIGRLDSIYRLRDGRLVSTTNNASGETVVFEASA